MKLDAQGWLLPGIGIALSPSPNFDARPQSEEISLLLVHNISLPPGEFLNGYASDLFLNRLDVIVNFKTLTRANLQEILGLELQKIQDRIVAHSDVLFELRVTAAGLAQLIDAGYDKRYNARHLVRAVEKYIANPLTRLVATQQLFADDLLVCDYQSTGDEWKYVAIPSSK